MATAILSIAWVYFLIGAAFALWFVVAGAARLDETARGGSIGFRLLIFPGACALWPVLLWKFVSRAQPLTDASGQRLRALHRWLWPALAAAILILLWWALR